jgi:hypothetical protein
MKKIILSLALAHVLFLGSGLSFAEDTKNPGAGETGSMVSLGYDGSYLYYKETLNGSYLDKDTGWLNGGFLEMRGDNEDMFTRITIDYTMTNKATYSGSLQGGGTTTPYTATTKEEFYQGEVNMGWKALNFGAATLSPYAAIGYRDWKRGQDNLPDYLEEYTWWYAAVGANLAYRHDKWFFSLDGAVAYPFSAEMTTTIAGQVDPATFNIKPRPGYRVEIPTRYRVYRDQDMTLFIFGTPYYQRWKIGASDPVTLTQGGTPVGTAIEPDSTTDVYGIRIGVAVNF